MTTADVKDIFALAGPFLGFFLAWLLFELTERRKVRMAERALREALVAELRHAELLLSSMAGKYAYVARTPAEITRVASEIRWFVTVGRLRTPAMGLGELADPPPDFDSLNNDQIVASFARLTRGENSGSKLILPVIDATLAGRTSGFTAAQIQTLSSVRWQAHVLEQDADWMAEFLRLTYTVADADNHQIVSDNLARRTRSYTERAGILLGCVRAALDALEESTEGAPRRGTLGELTEA